jgi:hypothetical protein
MLLGFFLAGKDPPFNALDRDSPRAVLTYLLNLARCRE